MQNVALSWTVLPVRQHGNSCHLGQTAQECDPCSERHSTTAAAFSSDKLCGMMLVSAGSFGGCHSIVDPKCFFQNCVSKLCISNGNNDLFCGISRSYTFALWDSRATVKSSPQHCCFSHDIHCQLSCYERHKCQLSYFEKPQKCGCLFNRHY